ncbi:MAG: hypothetical protein ALAOOOJD_00139 [bacterium]|nr:hypothetical protein [bacterium]
MRSRKFITRLAGLSVLFTMLFFGANNSFAHCDALDGPVIKAAQKALETGNVNLALIWVQQKDEAEIKKAFAQTLQVRKLSPEAKQLADMYFFETLVRVHRAGEGAPYTGLKPAGLDLGPAIPAGDKALETGSAEPLLKLLTDTMHNGLHKTFTEAKAKKNFSKDDVEAGREYVQAYVTFIHYVEGVYEAAKQPAAGHSHETNHVGMSEEKH